MEADLRSQSLQGQRQGRPAVLDVVFASNALGIGGTERGMISQALAMDPERIRARVVGIMEGGVRQSAIEAAGLPAEVAGGDAGRLTDALRGADVVVVSRQGITEPLLPAAANAAGVPHLVEWSQFGHVDLSDDEAAFDCHLFVSQMIELRYRGLVGDPSPDFHRRHRVQHLPIERRLSELAPDPRSAREALGLDPHRPVIGRIGRAHDWKWRDLLVDMLPELFRLVPETQVVFVGATPAKRKRLRRRGVLDRCTLIEPTEDDTELATIYAALDVSVGASQIGETLGLANLEPMSLGIPVVTCSTPWADNAQIEFVEHGVTGLIANHPRPFAEAVARLLSDEEMRARLGGAARAMIDREFDPEVLAAQLERLCFSLVESGTVPGEWTPSPEAVDAFAAEYERRERLELRPLTRLERAQAALTCGRERAGRIWQTLRTGRGLSAARQLLLRARRR
jgi:glycosyltransferase involved in cell wall biosynthesis